MKKITNKYSLIPNGAELKPNERLKLIRENSNTLYSCKKHQFEQIDYKSIRGGFHNTYLPCKNCDGKMSINIISHYRDGYIANGGNGDEILPGWE